jgi:hypothetical protein
MREGQTRKTWTRKELAFLGESINTLNNDELADALGRTIASVKNALRKRGIKRSPAAGRAMRVAGIQEGENHPHWKGGRAASVARCKRSHLEEIRTRNIVSKHIRRGHLKRRPCEVCGAANDIHAHHDDYSKPFEIVWLCRRHHAELHRRV